jgi:hypothetical protein
MNTDLKTKWVKALRSGEYQQCSGFLEKDGGMCCLGVLVHVQGENVAGWRQKNLSMLPEEFAAGLPKPEMLELAARNDSGQKFSKIADYIEANL